jgi:DNA-binding SARP family transcriptional activator
LFQAALERGDIPTALRDYQGPFLAGWKFPGTGHFLGWVDRVRIQLSRQFREANRHHVTGLREAVELDRALAVIGGWIEADPLDDEAQHCLIELLMETGDRAEALSQFDAYEQLLSLGLGGAFALSSFMESLLFQVAAHSGIAMPCQQGDPSGVGAPSSKCAS